MAPGDVDFVGLAISLVLVVVALVVSYLNKLDLEGSIAVAVVRALVQLLAVGAVLAFILDPDRSLALSWAWVVVMVVFAAVVLARRASEVPKLFPLGLAAFTAAEAVTLGVIFGYFRRLDLGFVRLEQACVVAKESNSKA